MTRSFFKKFALAGLGLAALFTGGAEANAGDYCREYTRTVYIGSRVQEAYGTACLQPDGAWMIVGEGPRYDVPDNATNVDYVIHDNRRIIVPPRVVYYDRSPVLVRSRYVQPSFVWYHNGHYKNGHYVRYDRRNDRWDRHDRHDHRRWDRHDRDDHKGRGRGHGRDWD
jgi:hypothetical protein